MKRLSFIIAFVAVASVAAAQQKPSPSFRNMSADSMTVPAGAVSAAMLASGAASSNLGFTPARVINVMDGAFGAKGDGVTDDTAAFAAAIAAVNASAAAGQSACLTIPKGIFYINGATLPGFTSWTGSGVCGAGSWKSIIHLGPNYSGDLFAWSDSWAAGFYTAHFASIALPAQMGVRIEGVTVYGDRTVTNTQNAFALYDHIDWLYLRDVAVDTLHGRAFYAGAAKNDSSGYIRESVIHDFRIWHAGATTAPAFEITSQCSGSCVGSDASNEIRISDVNIFASASVGFRIRNEQPSGAGHISNIQMQRVRVENDDAFTIDNTLSPIQADLMQIGDGSAAGLITRVSCFDCELISPTDGYYALRIAGQTQPGYIQYSGEIFGANGGGIRVDAGNNLTFHPNSLSVGQKFVSIASSATVGGPIVVDDDGREIYYVWDVDTTSAPFLTNGKNVWGVPGLSGAWLAPFPANGDIKTGPTSRGAGAVDWQMNRYDVSQGAMGQSATICGGSGNVISPFATGATICGGFNNTAAGQGAAIGGGYGNLNAGNFSLIAGGYNASTFGLYGVEAFASGQFATSGDAELLKGIMRAATSSTTTARLTADGTGVPRASSGSANIWNLPDNTAMTFNLSCVYRDTTNTKSQSWQWLGVLISRGSGAATTAVAAPAATNGQNIGSPGATPPTLSADTTNGGLNISFTAPNSDASHIVCGMSGVVSG